MTKLLEIITYDTDPNQLLKICAIAFGIMILLRAIVYAIFYFNEIHQSKNPVENDYAFVFVPMAGFVLSLLGLGVSYEIRPLFGIPLNIIITIATIRLMHKNSTIKSVGKFYYTPQCTQLLLKILKIAQITIVIVLSLITFFNILTNDKLPDGIKEVVITEDGNVINIMEDGTQVIDMSNGGFLPTPEPEPTAEPTLSPEEIAEQNEAEKVWRQEALEYAREYLPQNYTELVYEYYSLLEEYERLHSHLSGSDQLIEELENEIEQLEYELEYETR